MWSTKWSTAWTTGQLLTLLYIDSVAANAPWPESQMFPMVPMQIKNKTILIASMWLAVLLLALTTNNVPTQVRLRNLLESGKANDQELWRSWSRSLWEDWLHWWSDSSLSSGLVSPSPHPTRPEWLMTCDLDQFREWFGTLILGRVIRVLIAIVRKHRGKKRKGKERTGSRLKSVRSI